MESGRQQPTEKNAEDIASLVLNRQSLKDYMTEGAIPPKFKGKLKDHKNGKPLREVSDLHNKCTRTQISQGTQSDL